jgi:hypothetical protein
LWFALLRKGIRPAKNPARLRSASRRTAYINIRCYFLQDSLHNGRIPTPKTENAEAAAVSSSGDEGMRSRGVTAVPQQPTINTEQLTRNTAVSSSGDEGMRSGGDTAVSQQSTGNTTVSQQPTFNKKQPIESTAVSNNQVKMRR